MKRLLEERQGAELLADVQRSGDWTVHLTLDQTARGPLVALVGLGGW